MPRRHRVDTPVSRVGGLATDLVFPDWPTFRPRLSPEQCIRAGIFGGCYFNPRGGRPGILGDAVDIDVREFPSAWFAGLPASAYKSRRYLAASNRYGVVAGSNQAAWERAGWVHPQDPRGWFQWYCRFYMGRRTADDARQVRRWAACAGPRGRWRGALARSIVAASNGDGKDVGKEVGSRMYASLVRDARVRPVVRQTLLHWAYEMRVSDLADFT